MLAAIMLAAFIIIAAIKLVLRALSGKGEESAASDMPAEPENRGGD